LASFALGAGGAEALGGALTTAATEALALTFAGSFGGAEDATGGAEALTIGDGTIGADTIAEGTIETEATGGAAERLGLEESAGGGEPRVRAKAVAPTRTVPARASHGSGERRALGSAREAVVAEGAPVGEGGMGVSAGSTPVVAD
jgi:hypothetical protein